MKKLTNFDRDQSNKRERNPTMAEVAKKGRLTDRSSMDELEMQALNTKGNLSVGRQDIQGNKPETC